MIAATATPGPLLLVSNVNAQHPGMVGILAASEGLDEIGRVCGRAWGDISDPAVLGRLESYIRAASSVADRWGCTAVASHSRSARC